MRFTLLIALSALCVSACGPASDVRDTGFETAPNVIVILADDLGWGDLAIDGGTSIATPNIDALANSGVRFDSAYAAAAVSSPARAALITGRYPQRFGYYFEENAHPGLPTTEVTLAKRLQRAGYVTGMLGTWQLGFRPEQRPNRRGFDEFFGASGEANGGLIYRGDQVVEEQAYPTTALTREALSFISRHRDERFFLYLAHFAPSAPQQAPQEYLERYRHIDGERARTYAAKVAALDDSVGAIVSKLDELDIANETLVIFLSDNGCPLYPDRTCSNAPFSGGKGSQLEGGIRIPLIMRWPDHLSTGEVYRPSVSAMDVFPTVLEAAGIDEGNPNHVDGVSLLPFLHGERSDVPHEILYWAAGPNRAVRVGDWKLWKVNRATRDEMRTALPGSHAFSDFQAPAGSPNGQLTLLYDLANDPGETRNLAASQRDQAQAMTRAIEQWAQDMAPPSVDSTHGAGAIVDGQAVELIF